MLFFLGVIGFQALVTAGLILGLVSRDNLADARVELLEESARVYSAYNSWVRVLWKSAVQIESDPMMAAFSADAMVLSGQIRFREEVSARLQDTGIDAFVIRNTESPWFYYEVIKDTNTRIYDFSRLQSDRDHPFVSLRMVNEETYLTSTLKIDAGTELYLLKHINQDFYEHLTESERALVLVTNDKAAILAVAGSQESLMEFLETSGDPPPYLEFFNRDLGKGHYNFSFQNLGTFWGDDLGDSLYLAVFLSDAPYRSLQYSIGRIVLLVTGITVLFTLLLGLYSTGRITGPVNRLIAAMARIRSSEYDVEVPVKALGEVRHLLEGFNEMAQHLNHDRLTMDANIREITFLKDYNETIIHSLRAGIIVVSRDLTIEMANGFFRKSFPREYPDLIGLHLKDLNLPIIDDTVNSYAIQIANGEREAWSNIARVGDMVWEIKLYSLIQIAGQPPGKCVLELNDISRKVELEEKILQAEKLSSLSFLSAGIAHEINNPLSSILANVQNLKSVVIPVEDRDSLTWIEQETQRIARIVRELLDFSRETTGGERNVDVNECLENVIRLTRYGHKWDSDLSIELKGAAGLPRVNIPPDELKQVALNLIQNAVHALDKHGSIRITTAPLGSDTVTISVEDDGEGIPSKILSHIFDPFFTTKTNGEGTGLGLSIVYGIMGKNGGHVDVKSQENLGTTVTLTLPAGEGSSDG